MKIRKETMKVKQGKKRDEQNMRIEINYNIKSNDLICGVGWRDGEKRHTTVIE